MSHAKTTPVATSNSSISGHSSTDLQQRGRSKCPAGTEAGTLTHHVNNDSPWYHTAAPLPGPQTLHRRLRLIPFLLLKFGNLLVTVHIYIYIVIAVFRIMIRQPSSSVRALESAQTPKRQKQTSSTSTHESSLRRRQQYLDHYSKLTLLHQLFVIAWNKRCTLYAVHYTTQSIVNYTPNTSQWAIGNFT